MSRPATWSCIAASAVAAAILTSGSAVAGDAATDPYAGNAQAIEAGQQSYRTHCFICHLHAGGRGPNLFASKLSDSEFLETVVKGRGMMPAWGNRLSVDDIWKLRAFVKSTDHYGN